MINLQAGATATPIFARVLAESLVTPDTRHEEPVPVPTKGRQAARQRDTEDSRKQGEIERDKGEVAE